MPSCCLLGFAPPPAALHLLRRRMASAPSRAFQLRLNPLTGDSEWLVVEEAAGEEGHSTPPPRQLLATTSYLDMLNDSARNRAFRRAIDAAVTDPSSRVLDIGSDNSALGVFLVSGLGQDLSWDWVAIHDGCTSFGSCWRWVLQLDSAGSIFYSTAPRWVRQSSTEDLQHDMKNWCDHWKQCVWFMQEKGIPAMKGQVLSLQARHNQTSISYQMDLSDEACDRSIQGDHLMLLPERVALYGDKDWRSALINTIGNALTVKSSPICVVADDSLFLALLISSLSPTSKVIAMYPGLRDKGATYLRAVADANNFSINQIQVIGKRASSLTADDLKHKKVNLLVGEPFYYGSEGMLPWQNLRFWNVRTLLDSMLSEDAFIMPCKGVLKLCAMSLPDLWRSRCSLKDVEGFDHSVVNETLGACGDLPGDQHGPCLPYYVWQCGYTKKLSEVCSLMEFNFSEKIHSCFGKTKIEFSHDGICHGFAVWIDWVLDEKKSVVLTTGP
ncbi:hypothetical protein E2562_011676, partial [Oryza meyeriana var. granulata]